MDIKLEFCNTESKIIYQETRKGTPRYSYPAGGYIVPEVTNCVFKNVLNDRVDATIKNNVNISIIKNGNYTEDYTKGNMILKIDCIVADEARDYLLAWVRKYKEVEKCSGFFDDLLTIYKDTKGNEHITENAKIGLKYVKKYLEKHEQETTKLTLRKGIKVTIKYDENEANDEVKIFPVCICKEVIIRENRNNENILGDEKLGTHLTMFISTESDQVEITEEN